MAISAALLCFDELEVIDNADAILGQLLEHLFARDVLCEAPLGSLDYQRTAHTYHTPMVDEIPCSTLSSAAKRAASSR